MTFDEWFQSKQGEQGEHYDSMYVFARDAWNDAVGACSAVCSDHTSTVPQFKTYEDTYLDGWLDAGNECLWEIKSMVSQK